jgi:hypothetical protein
MIWKSAARAGAWAGALTLAGMTLVGMTLAGSAALAAPLPAPSSLPDFTGLYVNAGRPSNTDLFDGATSEPVGCSAAGQPCRSHPPYNATWEAKYGKEQVLARAGTLPDPLTSCMPRGTPGNMRSVDSIEFVVRPERVWIFIENANQVRHIYTDGRGHRTGKDGFDNFSGDSIGHWEGDTLVVDTVGVKGEMMIDRSGAILSNKAHIVERIRRKDPATMEDVFTIDDPVALTHPWTVTLGYDRTDLIDRLDPYYCELDDRIDFDKSGKMVIKPPVN